MGRKQCKSLKFSLTPSPFLAEQRVFQIEDIYQSAYRHRFYRGGPVLMSALSGLGRRYGP